MALANAEPKSACGHKDMQSRIRADSLPIVGSGAGGRDLRRPAGADPCKRCGNVAAETATEPLRGLARAPGHGINCVGNLKYPEKTMNRLSTYAIVAFLSLAGAAPAFAHADLASASPAANATVTAAPTEITITFTEEVEPKFSTIEVTDAKGDRVDQGPAHTAANDAKILSVGLKALTPGVYMVMWHATAADDSHKTKGSYQFVFKP
jgi:methionine-rich copper-binding protein CopC